ncbi:MAG: LPS export ABC transporter periplasmic protein LptC [Woeseiaceae bacterium]|nr:LPS export ABC transporter periplasmic protein LptC [Woeseiaceae bacterium]
MQTRNLIILAVLAIAAFGSWHLARTNNVDEELEVSREPISRGYYIKSARIFGTDPAGNLVYEIIADRAVQLEDETVAFSDVNIRYAPDSQVPWTVDADEALIDPRKPGIQLSGHVRAISSEGFQGSDTEIRTEYMELDPESYIARTDQRVQIRIGARSLTATGMLASLQENQLELKSNISGKFLP